MVYNWYHMSTTMSSTTIKINVPMGILSNAQQEARRIGISLQDFIRMLMATYFANAPSVRALTRDQALYNRAQKEIREGKFTTVNTKAELEAYLDQLNA